MSSGTVDTGGTKVLLRHRKHRIILSKCSIGQILVSSTSLSVSIYSMAATQNFQCYLCGYIAVDLSTLLMHPCAVSTGIAC